MSRSFFFVPLCLSAVLAGCGNVRAPTKVVQGCVEAVAEERGQEPRKLDTTLVALDEREAACVTGVEALMTPSSRPENNWAIRSMMNQPTYMWRISPIGAMRR